MTAGQASGEIVHDGSRQGQRWCDAHRQYHGTLYVCPTYPQAVKDEIAASDAQFRRNLRDPLWRDEQRKNGVFDAVMDLFIAMGGDR